MKQEFLLPDLGEGLAEAEVVQWLVAVGDTVTLNQTLAEVETAKAVVELPSPYEGTVIVLHAQAGETVEVGAPLIAFEIDGDEPSAPDAAPTAVTDAEKPAEEKAQPNLVGYGAAPSTRGRPARRARRAPTAQVEASADEAVRAAAPHDAVATTVVDAPLERPRSTPPVRKYAKDRGVDLVLLSAELAHTDEAAPLITRADVDAYLARIAERSGTREATTETAPAPAPHSDRERTTRIPIRGVRKHTAEAMVRSAFTAPHVTTFHTVDVTATMALLASLRADRTLSEHRIGPLAIVAKAVCLVLPQHPGLNAFWDDAAGEIVQNHFVDLGIAAATDRGLIVPVIREAQTLSLPAMSDALKELAATARAGRTSPAQLSGGTFSITNIGSFGIDAGTPILPPGQSGILATGAVRRQPWEYRGEIALREVMTLSLSFDHRLVDGAEGARFLKAVADLLEDPGRALLY